MQCGAFLLEFVNPSVQGNAEVRADSKSRRSFDTEPAGFSARIQNEVQLGNFLLMMNPPMRGICRLGQKIRQELFSM